MQHVIHRQIPNIHFNGWMTVAKTASASLWQRLMNWRDQRRAIKALSKLDDRMLGDIGIDRSEIDSVVANGRKKQS